LAQRQAVSFAVLEVQPEPGERTPLQVTLANGERVHIPAGCDAGTLRMVLAALRERT